MSARHGGSPQVKVLFKMFLQSASILYVPFNDCCDFLGNLRKPSFYHCMSQHTAEHLCGTARLTGSFRIREIATSVEVFRCSRSCIGPDERPEVGCTHPSYELWQVRDLPPSRGVKTQGVSVMALFGIPAKRKDHCHSCTSPQFAVYDQWPGRLIC